MIKNLRPNTDVVVQGFVDTVRDQKSIMFVVLRDSSGMVQVTVKKDANPDAAAAFTGLQLDSTVLVEGRVVAAPNVKLGGIEIIPAKVVVTSSAKVSPIDHESGQDLRMDYRWLDLRDRKKLLYFKFATEVNRAIREWFIDQEYIEINTPKLTGSVTEGGSEVFEVKYFDKKAYLTQSPQFFKQMSIAAGFDKTFEFGAMYRAEKSYTSRHATEFFSLDVEQGFIKDEHCVMDGQEAMLKYVFAKIAERCAPIFEELGIEFDVPRNKFPRVTVAEAYELLKKEKNYEVPKANKGDLDPEAERLLCEIAREKYGVDFMFVTNFAASARAFYIMRLDENPKTTRGYDLLYRGVEITSGGQREHRPDLLRQNIKAKGEDPTTMEYYIQFFEYGCPPHGGYCIGLARLVSKMLNLPSIKDAVFLFRGPDRLAP